MPGESETTAALQRAGRRAVYHLMRAGLEGLKAIEAVVDELSRVRRPADVPPDEGPIRIEVE
ncbi:MAG: hypothetical protein R6X29_09585 [Acidimicrobiia bacterium]|jgi:hypothetical protein